MKDLDNAISLALAGARLDPEHVEALSKSTVLDLIDLGLTLAEIEKLKSMVRIELQRNIAQQVTDPVVKEGKRLSLAALLKEELGMMVDLPPVGSSDEFSFTGDVEELDSASAFGVGYEAGKAEDDGHVMGHGGTARRARQQLHVIAQSAQALYDSLTDDDEIPEWSQSHIAQAEQMIDNVAEYLQYKLLRHEMNDG